MLNWLRACVVRRQQQRYNRRPKIVFDASRFVLTLWKEDECRKGCMTLVTPTRRSPKIVVVRKARRNTGCTTAQPEEDWKWPRGIASYPPSGHNWRRSHWSARGWKSEKHLSWDMPVTGFRDNVATDGSSLGSVW